MDSLKNTRSLQITCFRFNTYATFYPYLKCTGFNTKFKTDDTPVYRKYKKHHPNMKVNLSVYQ